jgi:hypothetical protein
MTITDTAAAVRVALAAAGDTISAQRAQDLAFTMYDLAEGDNLIQLESVLSLSLTRVWFKTSEIEAVLAAIEAQSSTSLEVV